MDLKPCVVCGQTCPGPVAPAAGRVDGRPGCVCLGCLKLFLVIDRVWPEWAKTVEEYEALTGKVVAPTRPSVIRDAIEAQGRTVPTEPPVVTVAGYEAAKAKDSPMTDGAVLAEARRPMPKRKGRPN